MSSKFSIGDISKLQKCRLSSCCNKGSLCTFTAHLSITAVPLILVNFQTISREINSFLDYISRVGNRENSIFTSVLQRPLDTNPYRHTYPWQVSFQSELNSLVTISSSLINLFKENLFFLYSQTFFFRWSNGCTFLCCSWTYFDDTLIS